MKVNRGKYEKYGESFTTGDVMGCCLDLTAGSISYTKNGKDLGVAFTNISKEDCYYPTVTLKNAKVTMTLKAPFRFPVPSFLPVPETTTNPSTSTPTSASHNQSRSLLAVILEPTRELAQQT